MKIIIISGPIDIPPPDGFTGKAIHIINQTETHYINGNFVRTKKINITLMAGD